ncbi:MAG: hypothetical protein ABI658_27835 [Acidimicrobiales bacterium]
MTTTATNTTTAATVRPAAHTHRLRRIAVAAGLTVAFAGTAALATNVLRDETQHHPPAVVVPGPYNGLPNLNDLGMTSGPSPTIVIPGFYNGLPNLSDFGVTVPTVGAGTGH